MSSGDLFFDTSDIKLSTPKKVDKDLSKAHPPFDWQSSARNNYLASIFAEEGANFAEDSQEDIKGLKPRTNIASSRQLIVNNRLQSKSQPIKQVTHQKDLEQLDCSIQTVQEESKEPLKEFVKDLKNPVQKALSYLQYEHIQLKYNSIHGQNNNKMSVWQVQEINQAHSDSIWCAKFSPCGLMLATGGKDATLKIWQIVGPTEDSTTLLQKAPVFELKEHALDIIDVSWRQNSSMILSCSFDQKVILWNLEKKAPLYIFEHPDVVAQISFYRNAKQNYFVSGSLDCGLRVWDIRKKTQPVQLERLQDPISALAFSPNGKWLVVGIVTGMCILYDCIEKSLNYKSRIDCKNKRGRFSAGRKISGLYFISDFEFLCATADSRLRLYTQVDCIQRLKLKSHFNEQLQINPGFDSETNIVITGSEDGNIYLWDRNESHSFKHANSAGVYFRSKQHQSCSFAPFKDQKLKIVANIAVFCPKEVVQRANQIQHKVGGSAKVKAVILVASIDGRMKLYWAET